MNKISEILAKEIETDVEISYSKKKGSSESVVKAKGNQPCIMSALTSLAVHLIRELSDSKEEAIELAGMFLSLVMMHLEEEEEK